MQVWLETKLHQLDPTEYSLLLLFMSGITILLLFRAYKLHRQFRFIYGTATSKIRAASQGYVELKGLGELMPGDEIRSPFSGSRCLWFHCSIEEKQEGKKKSAWTQISSQKSEHLFHLIDDAGECVIDPDGAIIFPEQEIRWFGSNLMDQNNPPKSAPTRASLRSWKNSRKYRFQEKLIRPATEIYAIGNFETHRLEPEESLINRQVDDLMREWKLKPGKYLTAFDRDGSGKIEDKEWANIRSAARRQVMMENLKLHKPQNLLSKPDNTKQPYIISAIPEEELVSRKKNRAMISLITAFVLFCAILLSITIRPPFIT